MNTNLPVIIAALGAILLVALFSGFFSPKADVEPLTADEVLEQWLSAIGGPERLKEISSIYTHAEIKTSGFTGTVDDWSTTLGQHRTIVDLGEVFKTETVFDGPTKQGWQVDLNGNVQPLGGAELEAALTTAFLNTYAHFFPDRWSGEVRYLGEDRKDGNYILEISPEGGRPVTYYIDHRTFLPSKTERREEDRTVTTHFSDWREVDGLMLSFHSLQTAGLPIFNVDVAVQQVEINPEIAANAFDRPEGAVASYVFNAGSHSTGIPIELNNDHIYLKASLNGSDPKWFLLDSGAGITVVSRDFADSVGLDLQGGIEGRGTGEGSVEVALASGVSIGLSGVEVHNQTVAAIDLSEFEPFEGRPMNGILGSSFFNLFVVEIDYENLVLNIYDPAEYSYNGSGTPFDLTFLENNPTLNGTIELAGESYTGTFLIDTGASSGLGLGKPFVESHNLLSADIELIQSPFGLGVGGETRSLIGRIDALKLGPHRFENVVTGFSQDEAGTMANPAIAGLIGGDLLRRFTAIFNYSQQQLILEPNDSFDNPFEWDMSGLVLRADGENFDQINVFRVVENGPGDRAGFEVGDVITSIDGEPASRLTLERVRHIFMSGNGNSIDVGVSRDGNPMTLTMTLERQI